jgi:hypothetical protein
MGTYDNPSAGKFDPPPGGERFDPPQPERRGAWIVAALGIAVFLARESFTWLHPRGVWALAAALVFVVLVALQLTAHYTLEPDEHKPYSDQQPITR